MPFLYQTGRFRIFIQTLGFKKPSHKKECKGGFGKRRHGKLVRVHSRTFGHDDMGTARQAMPIPKGLDIVRILKEHGIAKRKRNTIEGGGQIREHLFYWGVGLKHIPEPRNHGVAGSDARQSCHRNTVNDRLDGGRIQDIGAFLTEDPVQGKASF